MCIILDTGNHVLKALSVLAEHRVGDSNIILLNLFSTPTGNLYV